MTTTNAYPVALCSPTQGPPPRESEWWIEPKLDGIRLRIVACAGTTACFTRSGTVYNGRLPAVESALSALDVTVDGEVVWFSPETGEVDFHKGSGLFRRNDSARAQRYEGALTFVAFDLLELAGQDVRGLPIETRRALLKQLVDGLGCPQLVLVEQDESSREAAVRYVGRYREGVVFKKKGSRYPSGRTPNWLKMKVVQDADVVIMDVERGNGKYINTTGCVVFGQYKNGVLTRRGTCSGMTDAERDDIWRSPEGYVGRILVIRHMGTDGEGFRHPQWDRLRSLIEGKTPQECVWS